MKFHCPSCDQKLVSNPAMAGRSVPCPNCGKSITVPEDPPDAPVTAATTEKKTITAKPGLATRSRSRSSSNAAGQEVDATNVSLLVSGLIGLCMTVPFYLALLLFKDSYLFGLFWKRGWVPPVEALLLFWSIGFLILKRQKIKKQQRGMLFDLLPDDIGADITAQNVELFIDHAKHLPVKPNESFLISRVLRGLEHFRARESNPEVASVLSSHSDTDANTMQTSYAILKVFIWAIPILGFIGTVQGLGSAVGGFSEGLGKAQDIAVLKDSLSTITVGLAVAFDTTLIALVMSVMLMFPMSSMQKSEEDLISRIDDYCNENLLKRLKEKSGGGSGSTLDSETLVEAMRTALEANSGNIKDLAETFTAAGAHVGKSFTEGAQQLQATWQAQREQELKSFEAALKASSEKSTAALGGLSAAHGQISESAQANAKTFADLSARLETNLGKLNETIEKAFRESVARHEGVEKTLVESVTASNAAVREHFSQLREDMKSVDETLKKLEAKGIAPGRRGWKLFGRG